MMNKIIKNNNINCTYHYIEHKSGLKLLLCPMNEYNSTYAIFATKFGSINDNFILNGDNISVPAGVAHFLEHKLFEDEDGDAFEKYAKTGANANAFTSFDRTAYLFQCTNNFIDSLKILLKFVTNPYFTDKSVKKEQGIIGQEINMYEDSPDWKVFFNLINSLYLKHPIKFDIAGSIESISLITPELLFKCYNSFYNLNNMVLCIAGKFNIDEVLNVCDKILKINCNNNKLIEKPVEEPINKISSPYVEKSMNVSKPIFNIGFKGISNDYKQNALISTIGELTADILFGQTSKIYNYLYDNGLINLNFDNEIMFGPNYLCTILSGESDNPKKVYDYIINEIKKISLDNIDNSEFESCKKSLYGRYISQFNNVESLANLLVISGLAQFELFDIIDYIKNITKFDVVNYIKTNLKLSALSVVMDGKKNVQ